MPADSNNNQDSKSNKNPIPVNLSQVSSSDAPPIAPGVSPVSDAISPRIGKDYQEPGTTPYVSAPPHPLSVPEAPQDENPQGEPSVSPLVSTTPPQASGVVPQESVGVLPVVGDVGNIPPTVAPPRPIKKILAVVGAVLAMLLGAFLVIKFVVPMFSGSGDGGSVGQTEIVWWGLWEDERIVAPIINSYQQKNPGIKITYVTQSKENYRERLASALARGEGPDIFRFHNSWVPMFAEELESIPSKIMDQQQFSQIFYPVMTRDLLTSEGIKGIPLEYDGLALFINEDTFATYGKTPPTTWNEFRQLAEEMTSNDSNGLIISAGASLGNTSNVDHWPEIFALIMLQNGVNLNNPREIASTNASQALQFYTDFINKSAVWDDRQPSSTIAFAAGKVAMYFAPSWRAFEIAQQNPDLKFRVVPVPQIPREDETVPDITYATYWAEGVSKQSKNKDEAWTFLNYLSQREILELFYQSASGIRMFGEPYPRQDMRDLILNAPKVGGIINLAPNAQSWYLASRTWDGNTGINTRINQYFEDAINGMLGRGSSNPGPLMETVSAGVQEVLVQYGLATPAPVTTEE